MGIQRKKYVRAKKNGSGNRMVIIFGGVAIVYFLAQIIGALVGGVETVSASRVSIDDSITVTGCFIRDETVIEDTKGNTIEHVVRSGDKVYAGMSLAVEYADQTALETNRTVNALSEQISLLESAMQSAGTLSDTSKIDQLISAQMRVLATQTQDGIVSDLAEDAGALRNLVMKRTTNSEDLATLQKQIETLELQKRQLDTAINMRANIISAPCEGYFSETVDGYEDLFSMSDIESMTAETFETKLNQNPSANESALGKVVRGFEWCFATVVPNHLVDGLKTGENYALRFSQISQDVPVQLYAMRPDANQEKTLLLFTGNVVDDSIVSMRQQLVDIVKGSYTGIKIPKIAVRTDGDHTLGVYTLNGSMRYFKPIEPLYEGDTYYVVRQGNTANTGVIIQDDIIIKARGLEDKKVVKK